MPTAPILVLGFLIGLGLSGTSATPPLDEDDCISSCWGQFVPHTWGTGWTAEPTGALSGSGTEGCGLTCVPCLGSGTLYYSGSGSWRASSVYIDNSDPKHPRRTYGGGASGTGPGSYEATVTSNCDHPELGTISGSVANEGGARLDLYCTCR